MAYLTIDDAPSRLFEAKLDYLLTRGVAATFFCEGRSIGGNEETLARALRSGYELGNHSYSHPRFSELDLSEARAQVVETDALLAAVYRRAGLEWKRKLFRFPFFDRGGTPEKEADIQALLADLGYMAPSGRGSARCDTDCDFDQEDYLLGKDEAEGGLSREAILARIGPSRPGAEDIILVHDHEPSHTLFFACVDRYLSLGASFSLLR
jgi:Predicted xylanase/chitin deacetylase